MLLNSTRADLTSRGVMLNALYCEIDTSVRKFVGIDLTRSTNGLLTQRVDQFLLDPVFHVIWVAKELVAGVMVKYDF